MKKLIAALFALTSIIAISPTPADAGGRCTKYESLLVQHAPRGGWDVARMSSYMYRESRCLPGVVNVGGGDTGLLQIHPVNWSYLSRKFGVTVNRAWLQDPTNNVRAAAQLCRFWRYAGRSCYHPWRTS